MAPTATGDVHLPGVHPLPDEDAVGRVERWPDPKRAVAGTVPAPYRRLAKGQSPPTSPGATNVPAAGIRRLLPVLRPAAVLGQAWRHTAASPVALEASASTAQQSGAATYRLGDPECKTLVHTP